MCVCVCVLVGNPLLILPNAFSPSFFTSLFLFFYCFCYAQEQEKRSAQLVGAAEAAEERAAVARYDNEQMQLEM